MEEKLKTKLSAETIDLAYHILDWLYFAPSSTYNKMPFSKNELKIALDGIRKNKIQEKIHKQILQRELQ